MAAAQWTLAKSVTGEPAMCRAMPMPCSIARSPIFLVSSSPPEVARSGWQMEIAFFSNSGRKPSFR